MEKQITATALRQNLFNILAEIAETQESISIFNSKINKSVVIMSEDEYSAIEETLYLLSNPKNRDKIITGMETTYDKTIEFNWRNA
ncbi:MAG: type II toxin-antitoxin system Phd/YefM family antitoxin [Clostridia bacterium]|nr:type II toxin-antitoxin system Phd/YefM family antitoxin [Clostridia bacterium]MDD4049038.1 type II toxin-antitoxin system Phd/YefM family antitoxin [Clostridia bacterium]